MTLDPQVRQRVSHLYGKTLSEVMSGTVGVPDPVPTPVPGVTASSASLCGPHGPVPVRVYRPDDLEGIAPALVWAHGGAWTIGDLDMPEADAVAGRVASLLPGVVVSVDYRLAPAHTYPVPVDDVVAAFDATVSGTVMGVDASRVALGGASAGGNLAASAALVIRDRGGQAPAALLLAYPATDPVGGPYPDGGCPPESPEVIWFDEATTSAVFGIYVGGDPRSVGAPAVPAAGALSGLPPTLVTTCEYDGLAPQGERFVRLLEAAGVHVQHHRVDSVLHGYLNMVGDVAVADRALDRHVDWLRGVMGVD